MHGRRGRGSATALVAFGVFAVVATAVLGAAARLTPAAFADEVWPTRPVKFILTLGPGSGTDIGARLLADRLAQRWGQPVVVENRPGGDGIVAINAFVSAHDDHQLLFSPTSSFTAHPFLHDHLPYRPSDLAPIARISNTVIAISAPSSLNVNSLDQLTAMARAEPGKLNWAGLTGAPSSASTAFCMVRARHEPFCFAQRSRKNTFLPCSEFRSPVTAASWP